MHSLLIQYVDPGTGSLITQLLLSFFIGVGFYLFSFRRSIRNWLRRLFTGKAPSIEDKPTKFEKVRLRNSDERLG